VNPQRIFHSAAFFQSAAGEPIRAVIAESQEAVVVAWHVNPGQRIAAHVHPHGQDTWTILSGGGEYVLDATGASRPIRAGDVVLAHTGCVHGVYNTGAEPLRFISVVSPAQAGYELATSGTERG
jgi:quercetin dioxygenase-like cupin family protein